MTTTPNGKGGWITTPPPMQPSARLTVSLTEDRRAIVLRSVNQHPDQILDTALVVPVETARAIARAMIETADKASNIVIPQTPLG